MLHEGQGVQLIDRLLFDSPADPLSGANVLGSFISNRSATTELDRQILVGFRESLIGVFTTERPGPRGRSLVACNEIDGLQYRIWFQARCPLARRIPSTPMFASRIVRFFDDWLLSDIQQVFEPEQRTAQLRLAAELALRKPWLTFRNPQLLRRSRTIQRRFHRFFSSRFGERFIVGRPCDIDEAMTALQESYRAREAAAGEPTYYLDHPFAAFSTVLPAELYDVRSVGVLSSAEIGLGFLRDYADVLAAFEQPWLIEKPGRRELLWRYLQDPAIEPAALGLPAEQDPRRASELFRLLLTDPSFDWERDGEELLREHKHSFYSGPRWPLVVALRPELLAAIRGEGDAVPSSRARRVRRQRKRRAGAG